MIRHIFCLLMLTFTLTAFAKVEVVANRTVLSINESLAIEIVQTGENNGQPQLDLLEKDFEILSKSQSHQFNMVNGASSHTNIWSISLMPKRAGELVIPAITIGSESSEPVHLVVHKKDKNNNSLNTNQEVFIQVDITPKKSVYVQQKVDLTLRIYYRVPLMNLALAEFTIQDALVEKIGEDKQYNKSIKQQNYQVIERHYAVFPQQSGILTIPAVRFEANITSSRNNNWPFFSQPFSQLQGGKIVKQSEQKTLTVKAKPDTYTGDTWLPAENVQVISQHSDLSHIMVGDSITITDKIIAKGTSANLLSEIPFNTMKDIKVYPDKAVTQTEENKGDLYGIREQKTALIPTQAGRYTIPDRTFYWWDTIKDKQMSKIIPGFSFVVSAKAGVQTPYNSLQTPISQTDNSQNALPVNSDNVTIAPVSFNNNIWFWIWLITLLLAIIIIGLLLYRLSNQKQLNEVDDEKTQQQLAEKKLLKSMTKSAKENDGKQVYSLFKQWAELYYFSYDKNIHQPNTLAAFYASIENIELKKQLENLEGFLYAPTTSESPSWQGEQFLIVFSAFLKQRYQQQKKHNTAFANSGLSKNGKIPPLNP